MDDMYIGKTLDERYEILERIGSGGMAVVYKALDHRLNRFVAIKILKADMAQDPDLRRRFHAESQAVAMLSHPNIVSVYDVNHSEGVDYIVMELIEGITLKQYINRKGILNWKEALHFTTQIAKALEHAHSRGIIHRDIKPHNIMILKDGNVKVADFGIARLLTTQNTLTKQTLGSVHYISPEQAKGGAADARSDIYSVGVVMYEMLTSRLPFEGDSAVSIAIQHISSIPLQPREINPNIPVGLEEITMKAMSPNLNTRYQSATELLADLEDFRKNPSVRFNYSNIPSLADNDIDATRRVPVKPVTETERVRRRVSGNGATRSRVTSEEYRENKKRSGRTTMLVGILCIAALLALIVWFMWNYAIKDWLMPSTPDTITVPSFVGQMFDTVTSDPDYTKYYRFEKVEETSDYPVGYILKQDPVAGRSVTPSENKKLITLTVSSGRQAQYMPDFLNKDYRMAESQLRGLNLNLEIHVEAVASEEYTKGYIFEQVPEAGTELEAGMSVYLTYSSGPEVPKVKVPDLYNLTEATAMSLLEARGLTGRRMEDYDDTVQKGRVCFQNYAADTEVEQGTEIEFFVSLGPDPATTRPPETQPPETTPATPPATEAPPETGPEDSEPSGPPETETGDDGGEGIQPSG